MIRPATALATAVALFGCDHDGARPSVAPPEEPPRCTADTDCELVYPQPCCPGCGAYFPSDVLDAASATRRSAERDAECRRGHAECHEVDCLTLGCAPEFHAACDHGTCRGVLAPGAACGSGALPAACGPAPAQDSPCARRDSVDWLMCVCHARGGAACGALASLAGSCDASPRPLALQSWSSLWIESRHGDLLVSTIAVTPDDRVVFSGGPVDVGAPTVARLPAALHAALDAWSGLESGSSEHAAEWTTRVVLRAQQAEHSETYPYNGMPPRVKAVIDAIGALINTPRTPLPCPAWDGEGAFSLTTVRQDFGVAPGPVDTLAIHSDGTVLRTYDRRGALTTTSARLAPAEIAALRHALIAADLGHFTAIFGGAGEGSNLRMIHLTTSTGECGRAFTNDYPAELAPIFAIRTFDK